MSEIFEEEFFLEDIKEPVSSKIKRRQAENICGDKVENDTALVFDSGPNLSGNGFPDEFNELVLRTVENYKTLPEIDYEKIYGELQSLTIKSRPTPTLQLISEELQKVQALKERVGEIMKTIIPSHTMKKRHVDILKDSWVLFSNERSADKRKADSIYRISEFESDFLAIDCLMKTASHIVKNLDSIQEILSRRITIVSLELKISELGRNTVTDYDFSGPSSSDVDWDSVAGEDVEPIQKK
jgi:hypothetical protein